MRPRRVLCVCTLLTIFTGALGASSAAEALRVSVSSAATNHVIGQPVFLTAVVENAGKESIRAETVYEDSVEQVINVLTSADGRVFQRFRSGTRPIPKTETRFELLRPGDQRTYVLPVLYTLRPPGGLAFDNPGQYWLRVRYRLIVPGASKAVDHESNSVEVQFRERTGIDVDVWESIGTEPFLCFLQSGIVPNERPDVPRNALAVLRAVPKSSFHSGLRDALRRHYERETRHLSNLQMVGNTDLEAIRIALALPRKEEPETLFADDPRLDVRITCAFPQQTPMEEVFKTLSTLSGVPLRLAPELRARSMACTQQTGTLRSFMAQRAHGDTRWVPDRNGGYRWVPIKNPKEAPRGEPPVADGILRRRSGPRHDLAARRARRRFRSRGSGGGDAARAPEGARGGGRGDCEDRTAKEVGALRPPFA